MGQNLFACFIFHFYGIADTLWKKTLVVASMLNFLGWTPLHEACNYGNLRIVQELVWSGANVNSLGYKAITPLHDAVINDHAKVGAYTVIKSFSCLCKQQLIVGQKASTNCCMSALLDCFSLSSCLVLPQYCKLFPNNTNICVKKQGFWYSAMLRFRIIDLKSQLFA